MDGADHRAHYSFDIPDVLYQCVKVFDIGIATVEPDWAERVAVNIRREGLTLRIHHLDSGTLNRWIALLLVCKVHTGISCNKFNVFKDGMCRDYFTPAHLSHLDLEDTTRQDMKGLEGDITTYFLRLHSEQA